MALLLVQACFAEFPRPMGLPTLSSVAELYESTILPVLEVPTRLFGEDSYKEGLSVHLEVNSGYIFPLGHLWSRLSGGDDNNLFSDSDTDCLGSGVFGLRIVGFAGPRFSTSTSMSHGPCECIQMAVVVPACQGI